MRQDTPSLRAFIKQKLLVEAVAAAEGGPVLDGGVALQHADAVALVGFGEAHAKVVAGELETFVGVGKEAYAGAEFSRSCLGGIIDCRLLSFSYRHLHLAAERVNTFHRSDALRGGETLHEECHQQAHHGTHNSRYPQCGNETFHRLDAVLVGHPGDMKQVEPKQRTHHGFEIILFHTPILSSQFTCQT